MGYDAATEVVVLDPGASASLGLPVSCSSQSQAVCTIVSAEIHLVSAGTCEVTASQAGNADYEAATPVQRSLRSPKPTRRSPSPRRPSQTPRSAPPTTASPPPAAPRATRSASRSIPQPPTTPASSRLSHGPNTPRDDRGSGKGKGKGGPRYTFVFDDTEAGARFYCKLDSRPYKPCASPKVYRRLKPERQVFRLKSVDAAGNASPVRVIRFFAGRRR
jgi:hypothetical protein